MIPWFPVKAYRPCPSFVAAKYKYDRSGQSLDEVSKMRGRGFIFSGHTIRGQMTVLVVFVSEEDKPCFATLACHYHNASFLSKYCPSLPQLQILVSVLFD